MQIIVFIRKMAFVGKRCINYLYGASVRVCAPSKEKIERRLFLWKILISEFYQKMEGANLDAGILDSDSKIHTLGPIQK